MDAAVLVGVAVVTTLEVRDNVFVVVVVGRRSQLQPGRRNGRAEGGRVIASHSLIVSRLLGQTRTLFLSWPSVVPPPLAPKGQSSGLDSSHNGPVGWGGVRASLSHFHGATWHFQFQFQFTICSQITEVGRSHYDAQSSMKAQI